MAIGQKSAGILSPHDPRVLEAAFSDLRDALTGLAYAEYYEDRKDIDSAMASLRLAQIKGMPALTVIRLVVLDPRFERWYEEYKIDPYKDPRNWRKFRDFMLRLISDDMTRADTADKPLTVAP